MMLAPPPTGGSRRSVASMTRSPVTPSAISFCSGSWSCSATPWRPSNTPPPWSAPGAGCCPWPRTPSASRPMCAAATRPGPTMSSPCAASMPSPSPPAMSRRCGSCPRRRRPARPPSPPSPRPTGSSSGPAAGTRVCFRICSCPSWPRRSSPARPGGW